MIRLTNVNAGYGRKNILKDISFFAEDGKITVILGKNGSGKSTILKTISGNIPFKGSISADGEEITSISANERAKRIALMPQLMKAPSVTVRQLVEFGRQPYAGSLGALSKKDREAVEKAIEKTGLAELSEIRADRISGGELQRAYFAMMLAQDAHNILLDEPGSYLDAANSTLFMKYIRELAEEKKAVIAVMHDINRALEIADHIIFIDKGMIEFSGSSRELAESGMIESELFLKRVTAADINAQKIIYL